MQIAVRPKVSVCIATYNQAAYIEECVMSVLAQTDDVELELLVGDDGSSDGTGDILEALKARFPRELSLIRRPANIGGTENYQDLVRRASGEFIAHLDGDDAWLPGKLLAQTRFLASHPECVAVYTNAIVLDQRGGLVGRFTNAQPESMGLRYIAAKGNFLMHSSLLYRAGHKESFLGLRPPVIDFLIHLSLARAGQVGYIDQDLAIYRQGTATSMVRNSFPLVQRLLWTALDSCLDDLDPGEQRAAVAHFAAGILIARLQGKAGDAGVLIDDAAARLGCSRAELVLCSLPYAGVVLAHHLRQRILRRVGRRAGLPVHARV